VEYSNENEINPELYDRDADYKPTSAEPLVYHLHGDIDYPLFMVLTEKDYIDFVIFPNRNDIKKTFPSAVRLALASNPILPIGYVLDDVSFRTILRSIVSLLHIKFRISNIAVMQHSQVAINNKIIQAERYIKNYIKDMLKMQQFWADPAVFSEELRHQLDSFPAR
jgi:hypothetical protein